MPTISTTASTLDLSGLLRGIVNIDQLTGLPVFIPTTTVQYFGTFDVLTLGGTGLTASGSPVVPTAGTITSFVYSNSSTGISGSITGLSLNGSSFGSSIQFDAGTNPFLPNIQSAVESALLSLDYTISGTAQADSYRELNSVDGQALLLSGANTFNWGAGSDLMELGGNGNDTVFGGAGDDTLTGGGGIDSVLGGADNDLLRPGSGGFSTNEFYDGEGGIDTFSLAGLNFSSGYNLNLNTNRVEFINNPSASANIFGFEFVIGSEQSDAITGNSLANSLSGRAGNDDIFGLDGNDTLIGGTGADNLNGGADNDLFIVLTSAISAGETMSGGTGTDTLTLLGANVAYVVDLDAEQIDFVAGGALGEVRGIEIVVGGTLGDSLVGAGDSETLQGEAGNDTLSGGGGADSLEGGADSDSLSGGNGADTLNGGAGDDDLGTVSFAEGADVLDGGADNDRVTFATTAGASLYLQVPGNAYELFDTVASSSLTGLVSLTNIETIVATDGNDTLAGSADTRRLEGGSGTDVIFLRTLDTTADGGEGVDTLDLGGLLTGVVIDIGTSAGQTGFENARMTSSTDGVTGTAGANLLDGRNGDDTLTGLGGADQLLGGDGNDSLAGGTENDTLDGGGDNDALFGDEGLDRLFGGDGTDSLQGGGGNDQLSGDAGNDTLAGGVAADRLDGGADDDDLFGEGSTDLLFGRSGRDQLFGGDNNDTLQGEAGNDILLGDAGADQMFGGANNDTLVGGAGNDTLGGGTGNDTLLGGANNDVYFVDVAGDRVFETVAITSTVDAGGIDRVDSAVTFSLSTSLGVRFVENLRLTGSAAINGTGNALANTVAGNGAANTLNGLAGRDVLTGGFGRDTFVFTSGVVAANADRITDFNTFADTIHIDNAVFFGLTAGALARTAFAANQTGSATTATHRIIYETDTGKLFFDRDGTGGTARVEFAQIGSGLAVTHADFFVI